MLKSDNLTGQGYLNSKGESLQKKIERALQLLCSGKPLILERFQLIPSTYATSSYRDQSLGERHFYDNQ